MGFYGNCYLLLVIPVSNRFWGLALGRKTSSYLTKMASQLATSTSLALAVEAAFGSTPRAPNRKTSAAIQKPQTTLQREISNLDQTLNLQTESCPQQEKKHLTQSSFRNARPQPNYVPCNS